MFKNILHDKSRLIVSILQHNSTTICHFWEQKKVPVLVLYILKKKKNS